MKVNRLEVCLVLGCACLFAGVCFFDVGLALIVLGCTMLLVYFHGLNAIVRGLDAGAGKSNS